MLREIKSRTLIGCITSGKTKFGRVSLEKVCMCVVDTLAMQNGTKPPTIRNNKRENSTTIEIWLKSKPWYSISAVTVTVRQ